MSDTLTRRGAVIATAGLAAAALLASRSAHAAPSNATAVSLYFDVSPGSGAIQIPGTGNIKVLNYALAAETLEAELYRQALLRLTTGGSDAFGAAITGLGIASSQPDVQYVTEFGKVEADHRDFLTNALGGNYVVSAGLKFDFSINSLDRAGVLALIYAAELTGVSAYLGAIPKFTDKTYLAPAAAILGTEARHTSVVAITRNALFSANVETAPLANENKGKDTPLTPDQVLYQGGTVPSGLTSGGKINPISGPNGFVFLPSTPPPPNN